MRSTAFLPIHDGDPIGWDQNLGDRYFADPQGTGISTGGIGIYNHFHFGSAHTNGIQAVFADGSVHTIGYDVDLVVFNALGTRNGNGCGAGGPATPEPDDLTSGVY
jgi:hypothetical protein